MAKKGGKKCLEDFGGEICVWWRVINSSVLGEKSESGAGDHSKESSDFIKADNTLTLWKMLAFEEGGGGALLSEVIQRKVVNSFAICICFDPISVLWRWRVRTQIFCNVWCKYEFIFLGPVDTCLDLNTISSYVLVKRIYHLISNNYTTS
jgi:hypothetical protein